MRNPDTWYKLDLQLNYFRVLNKQNLPAIAEGWGIGSIDKYKIVSQVGEGTYGQVYKAKEFLPGGGS